MGRRCERAGQDARMKCCGRAGSQGARIAASTSAQWHQQSRRAAGSGGSAERAGSAERGVSPAGRLPRHAGSDALSDPRSWLLPSAGNSGVEDLQRSLANGARPLALPARLRRTPMTPGTTPTSQWRTAKHGASSRRLHWPEHPRQSEGTRWARRRSAQTVGRDCSTRRFLHSGRLLLPWKGCSLSCYLLARAPGPVR